MASDVLKDIEAKLDRASENLRTLYDEFQALVNDEPLRVEFEFDLQSEWHTAYIDKTPEIDPRFAILAGEAIYQMRSSFEHLVWALVKANHKKPGDHNTFPTRTRPYKQSFRETTKTSSLRGVRKSAVALIEQLQPYYGAAAAGRPPSEHFVAVLDELARVDRHRTVHGMFVGPEPVQLRPMFIPLGRAQIVGFQTLLRPNRNLLVKGTKLARLRIRPVRRQPQVDMDDKLPVVIAFGDRKQPVALQVLDKANVSTRQACRLFEKFL